MEWSACGNFWVFFKDSQKQKAVKQLSEVLTMTEEPRTSIESRAASIFSYVAGKFLKHFC